MKQYVKRSRKKQAPCIDSWNTITNCLYPMVVTMTD